MTPKYKTAYVVRTRSVNLTAMMPRSRLGDSLLRCAEGYAISGESGSFPRASEFGLASEEVPNPDIETR